MFNPIIWSRNKAILHQLSLTIGWTPAICNILMRKSGKVESGEEGSRPLKKTQF
uniref:Uncharacterized protein n=1 Tax=Moniliophthora roreri TaxID=221103 RepID=A0A0W0GE31_MONRR